MLNTKYMAILRASKRIQYQTEVLYMYGNTPFWKLSELEYIRFQLCLNSLKNKLLKVKSSQNNIDKTLDKDV